MDDKYNSVHTHHYNLDYDLFVLDPKNPDTTDPQRVDCIYDALKRLDLFVKNRFLPTTRWLKRTKNCGKKLLV